LRRAQIFSNEPKGLYLTMLLHETVLHYKLQKMLLVYEWFKAILVITFSFCYAKEYISARFEKKVNAARFIEFKSSAVRK